MKRKPRIPFERNEIRGENWESALDGAAGDAFYVVALKHQEEGGNRDGDQHAARAEAGEVALIVLGNHPAEKTHGHVEAVGLSKRHVGRVHIVRPRRHERHQRRIDHDGLGKRHDDREEHLKAGRAVDAGAFVQRLRDGVEEALGDVVAHAGGGHVHEDQAGNGALLRKPQRAQQEVQADHREEAGEHAQHQDQVHDQPAPAKAHARQRVAHGQHNHRLEHGADGRDFEGVQIPREEIALGGEQELVVVQRELLRNQVVDHAAVLGEIGAEGLQNQKYKRQKPYRGNHAQHDIDGGIRVSFVLGQAHFAAGRAGRTVRLRHH